MARKRELPGGPVSPRPVIAVNDRPMREIVNEAWQAVHNANDPVDLLQRGGDVVEVISDDHGTVKIVPLDSAAWQLRLDEIADFVHDAKRSPARPPLDVVRAMLASSKKSLPPLKGIVQAPVFASNCRLISDSGYHFETGLWLALPKALEHLEVPLSPNASEQEAALTILRDDLLCDFPFEGESSVAHVLAAFLLPFVRSIVSRATPLFLIEGSVPGTGKTLLAQVIGITATGRDLAVVVLGSYEDEVRRVLMSKLAQSPWIMLLDNLPTKISWSSLAGAVTAPTFEDRRVGHSEIVSFPVFCTWLLTANNPVLTREIVRRTLSIRLVPNLEHPEEGRNFRHPKLMQWALENRPAIVKAILTLVQAWVAAGRPPGRRTLGGFEEFSEVVGGILEVAGVRGFLQDREEVRAAVLEDAVPWLHICQLWWEQFGDSLVGTTDVHSAAVQSGIFDHTLSTTAPGDVIAFGKALSKQRDAIWGRYRIRSHGLDGHQKVRKYALELVDVQNLAYAGSAGRGGGGLPKTMPQEQQTRPQEAIPALPASPAH